MTSPRLIFDDFFRNPFGGEMKSIGGMGGGDGVLENIQQQVADNGEALQSLQGGIGGLPSGTLPGGGIGGDIFQPAVNQPIAYENPGKFIDPQGSNPPPSITDAATDIDAQLRAEYDALVASAKKRRDEGFMGRMVLPGENLSFEQFKKMQMKPGLPFDMLGGPMQSDIFNIAQVEANPGMDYSNVTNITGDLFGNTLTGSPQILSETPRSYGVQLQDFGNRGYTGGGSPPVFIDGVNVNQITQPIYERPETNASMGQLFGRAFAGKPI
jgi:hypothetical protein